MNPVALPSTQYPEELQISGFDDIHTQDAKYRLIFALTNVNSVYACCEKVFRPNLRGNLVVVLRNNDGCIIERLKEAKRLGIKMEVRWFQLRST